MYCNTNFLTLLTQSEVVRNILCCEWRRRLFKYRRLGKVFSSGFAKRLADVSRQKGRKFLAPLTNAILRHSHHQKFGNSPEPLQSGNNCATHCCFHQKETHKGFLTGKHVAKLYLVALVKLDGKTTPYTCSTRGGN